MPIGPSCKPIKSEKYPDWQPLIAGRARVCLASYLDVGACEKGTWDRSLLHTPQTAKESLLYTSYAGQPAICSLGVGKKRNKTNAEKDKNRATHQCLGCAKGGGVPN